MLIFVPVPHWSHDTFEGLAELLTNLVDSGVRTTDDAIFRVVRVQGQHGGLARSRGICHGEDQFQLERRVGRISAPDCFVNSKDARRQPFSRHLGAVL